MPLAFSSRSHGTVAFGFFQIEIDMLLLERMFFLADDFCQAVGQLAEGTPATLAGFQIAAERIGSLHGAIAGTDLTGFIGATYQRFPFPPAPEDFKQNPEGRVNRDWILELIGQYGQDLAIPLLEDRQSLDVSIGEYRFSREAFLELLAYVEQGGYPRWRDEIRPGYVEALQAYLMHTART